MLDADNVTAEPRLPEPCGRQLVWLIDDSNDRFIAAVIDIHVNCFTKSSGM